MDNEPIALLSFLFLGSLIVASAWLGRYALATAVVGFVLLSNLTIQLNVDLFGFRETLGSGIAWAIIIYSATYIALDILAEKFDFGDPYKIAGLCALGQVVHWLYLWLFLPIEDEALAIGGVYGHLTALFETSEVVTIAALLGSVGWFANIAAYQWLKQQAKGRGGWRIGFRALASTLFGQVLNTAIFFGIVRFQGEPVIATANDATFELVQANLVVKVILALVSVPFVYFGCIVATGLPERSSNDAQRG